MNENQQSARPPTADTLIDLAQAGHLSPAALHRALGLVGVIPSAAQWQQFVWRLLLFLGAGLTVVGIFFFFAWNWADMSRIAKLGTVEVLIVVTAVIAWWQWDSLVGRVSLTAASLLVGALLAIYGQQYQIQADSWTLFALWAAFIAGWVVIGRFPPLWFIWQILLNVAVVLYWQQAVRGSEDILLALLFGLNLAAMLLWEWAHGRYADVRHRWWLRVSAAGALTAVFIPTMQWIIDLFDFSLFAETPLLALGVVAYVVTLFAILFIYKRNRRDLPLVTIALLFAIVTGATIVGRVTSEIDTIVMMCLTGVAVAGMGVAAVRFLQNAEAQ